MNDIKNNADSGHETMGSFEIPGLSHERARISKISKKARDLTSPPTSKNSRDLSIEFFFKVMFYSEKSCSKMKAFLVEQRDQAITSKENEVFGALCVEAKKEYESVTENMAGVLESLQDYLVVFEDVYGGFTSAIDADVLHVIISRNSKVLFNMLNPED